MPGRLCQTSAWSLQMEEQHCSSSPRTNVYEQGCEEVGRVGNIWAVLFTELGR